ncbi:MAG: TetR/AcrR family transcriptional regulator [Crocinitomicaceae bacterium]|jgi:TetR/AcrR family transcriptional regulator
MKLKDRNTENDILEAAKLIFMEKGLYGARMQDIANQAGINKALLHYYFRNKERLFDEVFGGALSRYFQNMDIISNESLPIMERVLTYADRFVKFLSEYPQMSIFLIKEISSNQQLFHAKIQGLKKNQNYSLISVLIKGMEEKEIPTIDPVIFLMNLHALCAYPFLAAPIFNAICQHNGIQWKDENHEKLLGSIHEFIQVKLSKH